MLEVKVVKLYMGRSKRLTHSYISHTYKNFSIYLSITRKKMVVSRYIILWFVEDSLILGIKKRKVIVSVCFKHLLI